MWIHQETFELKDPRGFPQIFINRDPQGSFATREDPLRTPEKISPKIPWFTIRDSLRILLYLYDTNYGIFISIKMNHIKNQYAMIQIYQIILLIAIKFINIYYYYEFSILQSSNRSLWTFISLFSLSFFYISSNSDSLQSESVT